MHILASYLCTARIKKCHFGSVLNAYIIIQFNYIFPLDYIGLSLMLFKLPIMVLSNAPKIFLLCPNYAPFCPIILHKLLLSEFEN